MIMTFWRAAHRQCYRSWALCCILLGLQGCAQTLTTATIQTQAEALTSGANAMSTSKTLLRAIVIGMGADSPSVMNAQYDRYFKQGSAVEGVPAVITAGRFLINGYAIPSSKLEYSSKSPNGYLVNQVPWLRYDSDKAIWMGGYKAEKAAASYIDAASAVATGIVMGLEVKLYDTDSDGYTDLIEADYKEGISINRIERNNDGTYRVYRGDIDTSNKTVNEGRVFDGTHFTLNSGEKIKPKNFDNTLAAGDIALFWYGLDGWVMQRAKEVNGVYVDGSDHQSYNIGGTAYADAMRFSRDNLFISNRPGEYANAHKYFGLNDNREGLTSSLWLVPTTDPLNQGAPISITSNSSAKAFLAKAIAVAKEKLANVAISADGKNVPTTSKWVTQKDYNKLNDVITRAEAVLVSPMSFSMQLDYQIYLLYLALNGSRDDIGARFGGFDYMGFQNETRAGSLTQ